jgi:hypothetical protein
MRVLYVLCDCGSPDGPKHYYTGANCPFSGWVAPFVEEALRAAAVLQGAGQSLTVEMLKETGLSPEAMTRVMVAEFAGKIAVPDALGVEASGSR